MTTQHGQLQRSTSGQFIRSPHGQLDDEQTDVIHPPTDLFLSVVFIDEVLYPPITGGVVGYVPEVGIPPHDPPGDPAFGLARWDHDVGYWRGFETDHYVFGWLIHVAGTLDESDILTPPGRDRPQFVHITTENRPITTLTSGLRVGLDRVRDLIIFKTGGEPNIKGLGFTVDITGSMRGAFSAGDGRDATSIVEQLTGEIRARRWLADDAEVLPLTNDITERWVQWHNRDAANFYGLPTPEGP